LGHIRLGRLPKTKPWTGIFNVLESGVIEPSALASATALAAEQQFSDLEDDLTINYCFWMLTRIVTASRSSDFAKELESLGIHKIPFSSGLGFVQRVAQTVEKDIRKRGNSTIFSRIGELSLRQILSANIVEQSNSLFGTTSQEIQAACRAISTRKQFGLAAKEFFALIMSRSIRYITDKELSNYVGLAQPLGSPKQVLDFQQSLDRYCLESAKIVEEFAAGWFSKHNWESNNNISEQDAAAFTAYAIHKIRMELREGIL
jgi:hypothetical protein